MRSHSKFLSHSLLGFSILSICLMGNLSAEDAGSQAVARGQAKAFKGQGNWKKAYDVYRKLVLDPKDSPKHVGQDLKDALQCLMQLGRVGETDALVEDAVKNHAGHWRLLHAAAENYSKGRHYGYLVGGKFERGNRRGGGSYVYSERRDRIRSLQLYRQALPLVAKDPSRNEHFNFYYQFAYSVLFTANRQTSWRLQILSDLDDLPDYDRQWMGGYYRSGTGAPVDAEGQPVWHTLPKSFKAAKSDGQRWRWLKMMAAESDPGRASQIRFEFAQFLQQQFGVRTLSRYGNFFGRNTSKEEEKTHPFSMRTLTEEETMSRLASGVKRFKMPAEFNFIKISQQIVKDGANYRSHALGLLAREFEDRQQYVKAANYYSQAGHRNNVKQITGNWGQFENVMTQSVGKGATVDYRFRNGSLVAFTATKINVKKLLRDVKAYIEAKPKRLDWQKINIANLGQRMVQQNQKQYSAGLEAMWSQKLTPRTKHYDKRITIQTPLKKPGAYLLTAKMGDGNISRVIIWVADLVIVKKNLDQNTLFFVCDAKTGAPVPGIDLKLFGYRNQWLKGNRNQITTMNQTGITDKDGQFLYSAVGQKNRHQWMITATSKEGRFAYYGFTGIWNRQYRDYAYSQRKTFVITDRPVYRPKQKVHFKFWVTQAKYEQEGNSPYANQAFQVQVYNPKNEKVMDRRLTCDEYGGFDGSFDLEKGATLGRYTIRTSNWSGRGSFRVEEYKKPEYEVRIEAPKEPVKLGDMLTATIHAKYYFGAPVTEARVKYKVLRTNHTATWYPAGEWDWLYQPGYWWFGYDYYWYPGWRHWGCKRPSPFWWGRRHERPEVVMENEAAIGHDGTLKIKIDTSLAKAMHADKDHKYTITAEVVDASRRTIVGTGSVLAARVPFKIYTWVDRGYYRVGDTIKASFSAQTLDRKPVAGKGELRLLRITYDKNNKPVETEVQKWALQTGETGRVQQQIKGSKAGQYRLSFKLTNAKAQTQEGGYIFCVRGEGFTGSEFRFNDLELVADKREYAKGDKVQLMVNTNQKGGTVLLFVRPQNGIYLPPKLIRLDGKSTVISMDVGLKDMPNFFVEALTVHNAKVHSEVREVMVPPESRLLKVSVKPSAKEFKPGEKAKVDLILTEVNGEPYSGSVVVSVYDKALEYISGGSNVPEMRSFFWKWRRRHYPRTESNLQRGGGHIAAPRETSMGYLGAFGQLVADMPGAPGDKNEEGGRGAGRRESKGKSNAFAPSSAPMKSRAKKSDGKMANDAMEVEEQAGGAAAAAAQVEPTVRTNFADLAYWNALLKTGKDGKAQFEWKMPENLSSWKIKVWAMGKGTRVGQGEAEVVTTKNLLLRLQAPRFFTQKDEVVLSANVHNYLKEKKSVKVVLELGENGCLQLMGKSASGSAGTAVQTVEIEAKGEARVDWRVKVLQPGEAIVRMKALTNEESDAMQMTFPAQVHGMRKMDSYVGSIRPEKTEGQVVFSLPAKLKPEDTRVEVRYSPTLAGALVDALPYMVSYPYGCTEQTLNRFLPTVITQNVLMRMKINLGDVQKKITNLNAQEIGDDTKRAQQWKNKRWHHNPVFDKAEVQRMVKAGVNRLASMQVSDGGWGWFSGWGERSYPHTTATVVRGLQTALENDVAIPKAMLTRGVAWMERYQLDQVRRIQNAPSKTKPYKTSADNMDALAYLVMARAKKKNPQMRDFLYRDRNNLSVYSKAIFGLALHLNGEIKKRDMLIENVDQYLVQDKENQTAYLKLPEGYYWWYWYGSEIEAQAYYLKLLSAVSPKSEKASGLVKYLINNRKHGTYWTHTRDTALCIEALADYLKASGEDAPDMTLEVLYDGKKVKEVAINASNLFTFDNRVVLKGAAISAGKHTISFRKKGTGPLYFNSYVTYFSLEDYIKKAGLEVKITRAFYRLTKANKSDQTAGAEGQVVKQKVEAYKRERLADLSMLKSGELVEVDLVIESKNDYEYILIEDMKPAGFEAVEVRSGYLRRGMPAYVEYRDNRVSFFVQNLARGKQSVSYRLRAEIPGKFSALPAKISAMYAPELKGNSDELKLQIKD